MRRIFVALVAIPSSYWLRAVASFAALLKALPATTLVSFLPSVFGHKHIGQPTTQSEQLFSAFIDNLPSFAWIKDIQGQYVYVNKRLERLTPYQNGWLGKTDADLWPEEIAATYRASDQKVVASREPLETVQTYLEHGEQLHSLVSKFPIFDNTGAVVMVGGASVDITERKQTEAALRESEGRFAKAFHASPAAMVIARLEDGRILEANESLLRLVDYSRDELIGRTTIETGLWTNSDERAQRIQLLLEQGTMREVETTFKNKSGEIRYALSSLELIELGNEQCTMGIISDITERRQAEIALRESEARYRAILEDQTELICRSAPDGTLSFVNDAYCRYFGKQPEELIGHKFLPLIPEEDVETVKHHIASLTSSNSIEALEHRVFNAAGELRWQQWTNRAILDPEGQIAEFQSVGRDITGRKRAEEARREAERKYRDIFVNAGEGIFQSTPEGRFISANPALARMHGFDSPEQLIRIHNDISRQIHGDPARRDEFKRLLEKQGVVRGFEHQVFRKDGSKIWISVNARVVRDEQGAIQYYEGTAQDISERKRAEARSEAFANLARKLSGARKQLDAGKIIAKTAGDLFGWDSCDLTLYDGDRDLVHSILNVDTINGERVDVTASISNREPTVRSRRVIDHGSELTLREEPIQFDEDAIPFGDKSRPSASLMTVPVCHASKVIGLLSIQSYTPRAYDKEALNDLEALADNCGEALNRIQAEEERRESEERYRDLVENIQDLVCTHDLEGRVLSANRGLEKLLGYNLKDFGEKTFRKILAPEVRDRFDDYLVRIRRDGFASGLMLVQTSTGERRIWEYHNTLRTEGVATPIVRSLARDVTDRRRAEEALREAERKYRGIFENASEGIFQTTPEGRFLTANPALARMLGFDSPEDLISQRTDIAQQNYVDPSQRERFKRLLDENDVVQGFEYEAYRQDGGRIWLSESVRAVRNEKGTLLYYEGITEDITERKRAEAALVASERRYRDIFTFAPVGIYQSLRDGTLVTANKALAEMLGYESVDELLTVTLGRDVYLDVDERERLIREYEIRGEPFDSELQWKRKDGSPIWVQLSAHAIRRVNGATECFEGFVRNVTDRKRAEEAQRDSEQRFRATFEQNAVGMAITDTDGNFLQVNTALCKYLGYSEAELLKLGVLDITRAHDRLATKRRFSEVKAGHRQIIDHEKCYVRKDGAVVWGHTKVVWLLRSDSKSSYSVAVIQDITERRLAQQALEKFSRRLIEAQETERRTIARELHDEIGQVLTVVKIGLETVKCHVPSGAAASRLEENIAIVDEALRLVRDLSLELHPAMLDDLGLAAALRWYIDRYAQRTGIRAILKLDNFDEQKRLPRDFETTCFRVVQEALTNVARHAQTKKASVELRWSDEYLRVTIKDEGRGFDPRALRKRDAAHVTLGLRGMQERAQSLGGKLKIQSTPSVGTEIHLVLPLSQPKQ